MLLPIQKMQELLQQVKVLQADRVTRVFRTGSVDSQNRGEGSGLGNKGISYDLQGRGLRETCRCQNMITRKREELLWRSVLTDQEKLLRLYPESRDQPPSMNIFLGLQRKLHWKHSSIQNQMPLRYRRALLHILLY